MPHVLTKTVYYFDELSDRAKENARDWCRQFVFCDSGDWAHVYEYAQTCAGILGIEIDQKTQKGVNGRTWQEPAIYFSGFSSQADGASFDGVYRYKKGAAKAMREHAPVDAELHRIADALQDIQRRKFYCLKAVITTSGRYCHSGMMDVEVRHKEDDYIDAGDAANEVRGLMRAFADWIYAQLLGEYEYQSAEAQVDEAIRANEYDFTEEGQTA